MQKQRRLPARAVACGLAFALLVAGCTAGPQLPIPTPVVPTATPVPPTAFQRGAAYVSYRRGELASDESDATLADIVQPLGANWLAVVATCYQSELTATVIDCSSDTTVSDDDLRHAISAAHARGMQVMLKPHINLRDATLWRGTIAPGGGEEGWAAWFASYTAFITHYAALARDTGAEYFVVGTELAGTSQRAEQWRAVVQRVRATYGGPLTYAANHSGEETAIGWWDALDAIGVDAYYPLAAREERPSIGALTDTWAPVVAGLGDLSRRWNRPVILTEVGYQSAGGTNRTPWGVTGTPVDLQLQADCYQAVFAAFAGKPWWRGLYWWDITPSRAQGGASDTDYTPINKPAAAVVRAHYSGTRIPSATASP